MGFQPDRPPELARTRASPADAAGPPTADIVSNELAIASVDQDDGILLVVEDRIEHPRSLEWKPDMWLKTPAHMCSSYRRSAAVRLSSNL